MEPDEDLKAENEKLNAEIERQNAEMASIKKKIKLAMKKQQADLQAKIQAAEQRAVAAETAFAVAAATRNGNAVSESDPQMPVAQSPEGVASPPSVLSSPSLAGSNGEIIHHPLFEPGNANCIYSQAFVDSLVGELATEKQQRQEREDEVLKERVDLENEMIELRKTKDTAVKQRDEARAIFDEELKLVKQDAEQRVQNMTKANEKLEAQLVGAAGQVAEAFNRMSATHEDLERLSKEGLEAKSARSNLVIEHESLCQELEQCRATLAEAQQQLLDKAKEMEEMAAARKSAQEGQEAAISQLMSRLSEMEAAGTGQQAADLRESNESKIQSLLEEKDALVKELEKMSEAKSILHEELLGKKDVPVGVETNRQDMVAVSHVDDTVSNLKAEHELQLEELRSQTNSLQQELEELRKGGQQADLSALKEYPFLKEQLEESNVAQQAALKELSVLKEQLEESRVAQQAAESQIKRLSVACNEVENQVLTMAREDKDGYRNLDEELKLRDEKYAELDAKFGRLQKRAKQRIQEVQKEKEEVETQLAAASTKAAEALSKQAALQDDLELARHKAGEALRAFEGERQQLRSANVKLMEELGDHRHSLDAKERSLAESRRLASERDQAALELTATLKEAEANHASAVLDIKEKHRKMEESMTAQLAHASSQSNKMAETVSALQAQLGAKESKLVELDAASSGEMVRLGASLEAVKGELSRLGSEREKEQEQWQADLEKLRRNLEDAEKIIYNQAVSATEMRGQLESELKQQRQVISTSQAELLAAKSETMRVASDFAAYKLRANSVLQKKDAEILAAKDLELAAAQETALQNAKQEAILAAMERDRALKALQQSAAEYEDKLAMRDRSVLDAEHRIRDLAIKLEASKGQLLAKHEEWQMQANKVEATWRSKCDALEASIKGSKEADLKHQDSVLITEHNNLKVEFQTFRDLVDTIIEEKDEEISRLSKENATLQRPVISQPQVRDNGYNGQGKNALVMDSEVPEMAEQQILLLARKQAQREEEVTQCRRHIQALQEEITDLETENRLHSQQEALLKEEVRNLERGHKRDGVDMTYLKNVILKLLETGEVEALLPVVAMLLQFSPDELKRCHDAYNNVNANNVPLSGAAAVVDSAVSAPRTFFSNFKFTGGS